MNITLAEFQLGAVNELMFASDDANIKEIVLKSPTGSGKTIILTHFMDEYLKSHTKTVFIWLTPGKGGLETQSKEKMDRYIHNAQTKELADVMTSGFEDGDSCFINWEKLTKKGNNALKDSERASFLDYIKAAQDNGISFKIIVDESHQNDTVPANSLVQYFKTDKIIRCSATPTYKRGIHNKLIEIKEEEVIAQGLIKKLIVINQNFERNIVTKNQTQFLIEKAIEKQRLLRSKFLQLEKDINPLIIVQLPNKSDALLSDVQKFFEDNGITVENEMLAIWLSDQHCNVQGISSNDAKSVAVIMKQAVATGWDCPRAQILVKLRDNMDETFEIQTIGRIRRMPEQKHYDDNDLDSCYLYTFDSKFTEGVKAHLGKNALNEKILFLKNEYKKFVLPSEKRTEVTDTRSPQAALSAITSYFIQTYGLTENTERNRIKLEANGFVFENDVIRTTVSGSIVVYNELNDTDRLIAIRQHEPISTTTHGREYHHKVGIIGREIGMQYSFMNTIIGRLFGAKFDYNKKFLALTPKELYAFIINNDDTLRHAIRLAMAFELQQESISAPKVSNWKFHFPNAFRFTYDEDNRVQTESTKNVYDGYRFSAEIRSSGERKFEKYCERCRAVDWFYKNGDKGEEFLSVVYEDNGGKQKLFYPDYVLSVSGEPWIIETKGGWSRTGESQDIDIYTEKKFRVLKNYLDKNGLKGGIVRFDVASDELCICTTTYSNDVTNTDCWEILSDVIK